MSQQGQCKTANFAIYELVQKSVDGNWIETKESNLVPSIVVESPDHHDFDQALKLPKMTVKAGWKIWTSSKSFSKFDKISSNLELVWLGEWWLTIMKPTCPFILTSHNRYSVIWDNSTFFKAKLFLKNKQTKD